MEQRLAHLKREIMHEKLVRNIQIRAAGAMNQPKKNTLRLPESKTRTLTKTNQISIADPLKQRTNDLTAAKSILEKARTPNIQQNN